MSMLGLSSTFLLSLPGLLPAFLLSQLLSMYVLHVNAWALAAAVYSLLYGALSPGKSVCVHFVFWLLKTLVKAYKHPKRQKGGVVQNCTYTPYMIVYLLNSLLITWCLFSICVVYVWFTQLTQHSSHLCQ